MMLEATDQTLVTCFTEEEGADAGGGGFTCQQFKASINSLLSVLQSSHPFFIRCLKPNQTKIAGDYDFKATVAQLASLSILDALALSQKGYPQRDTYTDFLERVKLLVFVLKPQGETDEQKSMDLLEKVGDITPQDYKAGTTKLFLKKTTFRLIENKINAILRAGTKVYADLARICEQSRVCKKYTQSVHHAVTMQSYARAFKVRLVLIKREKRKRALWGACAWAYRLRRFRRDRLAAMTLQVAFREIQHMYEHFELVKQRRSQAAVRKLRDFIEATAAQAKIREALDSKHAMQVLAVVRKISNNWIKREHLRRFWYWRGILYPAKRLVRQRIRMIIRVQARLRAILARRTPIGRRVKEKLEKCRTNRMLTIASL